MIDKRRLIGGFYYKLMFIYVGRGGRSMLEWLIDFADVYVVGFIIDFIIAMLVLFVGLKLVKFLVARIEKRKFFKKLDSNMGSLVLHSLRVLLNSLIVILTIEVLGVPSATIIAVIGSCGLALGLALQGGLSNLAGGVMIMIFKPFHSGDYICTTEGEGFVEEIGIFYTKLLTIDNRCVNIPNSVLSSTTVTNTYAKDVRGVEISLSLAYGTDISVARRALLECAAKNPLVLDEPATKVLVASHDDSCIKITLRAFVKSRDYLKVRPELLEATLTAIRDAGLEIPFPQIDVHMK